MYVKAISFVESEPKLRSHWTIEVDEFTRHKFCPKNYKEVQEKLKEIGSEYTVPLRIPQLEEGYNWDGQQHCILIMLLRRKNGTWVTAILSLARVFIMGDDGKTIDRFNV